MSLISRLVSLTALTAIVTFQSPCADARPAAAGESAPPPAAAASNLLSDSADTAWQEVQDSTKPPLPPGDWNQRKPTDEEYAAFRLKMGQSAAASADRAREFTARFATSPHATEAQEIRALMLRRAVQLGVTDRQDELASLGDGSTSPQGGATPASGPFDKKMRAAVAAAMAQQPNGMQAVFTEFEKGVRDVMVEFPDRPEVYVALLQIAGGIGGERGREIAKEIQSSATAPDEIKEMAGTLIKKYERIGQPVELQFTAVDGREVSMAALKGKVVLIDFWATWCGPCVAELPNVKAAYEKLHPKGFEIVGISFDQDKEELEAFVKKKGIPWPQFFDGKGWQSKYAAEFGINSIPAMWLVDTKGILRDFEAREDLAGKVEKLLADK